jgi:hypothetical protein
MASDFRSAATSGLVFDTDDFEFDRVYLQISISLGEASTFLVVIHEVRNRPLVPMNDIVCTAVHFQRHHILAF